MRLHHAIKPGVGVGLMAPSPHHIHRVMIWSVYTHGALNACGEKWGKVGKSWEKLPKVGKSSEKWEKIGKNGEKWWKVGKGGEK